MAKKYSSKEIAEIVTRLSKDFSGGDSEFARILHAIVLAESGGDPTKVGDNGNSVGLFQNNMASGRGIGHSYENLLDPEYNTRISLPELYQTYLRGISMGLRGANLTAYVSRYGQRPAAGLEMNAAKFYGKTIADIPITPNRSTPTPTPTRTPTNTPTPTKNPFEMVPVVNVKTNKVTRYEPRYPEEYKKATENKNKSIERVIKNQEVKSPNTPGSLQDVYRQWIDAFGNPFNRRVQAAEPTSTPTLTKAPMRTTLSKEDIIDIRERMKKIALSEEMGTTTPTPTAQTSSPEERVTFDGFDPSTPNEFKNSIIRAAQISAIPTSILSSLLAHESVNWDPDVIAGRRLSSTGAQGVAQFMPETAKLYNVNPIDPEQAIQGAARLLRDEYNKFGRWDYAIAAYNAGAGAVQKYQDRIISGTTGIRDYDTQTKNYVQDILYNRRPIAQRGSQTQNRSIFDQIRGAIAPKVQAASRQSTIQRAVASSPARSSGGGSKPSGGGGSKPSSPSPRPTPSPTKSYSAPKSSYSAPKPSYSVPRPVPKPTPVAKAQPKYSAPAPKKSSSPSSAIQRAINTVKSWFSPKSSW